MNNDINELREHMFATLRGLRDGTLDIDKAKAISGVGQVLIASAKVEVDFIKATGSDGSGFITAPEKQLPPGITGITRHQLK